MPQDINSISSNFRDLLLNRNLITDTVTQNGLDGLLVGIGVPITDTGTPPEAVQASPSITEDGDLYKDLNLVTNKYQGDDDQYRTVDITYRSNATPSSGAIIYSNNYVKGSGILSDTLQTPANGPFQGGDIRKFNSSKNLYDDPSMRLLVDINDTTLPNVKYTNYIDLNSSIVNPAIDVLGSIVNGQGVGIATGGALVPTFDLRASLVGRVLGGTGIISDTPIGQAGAKYLGMALANNLAFGLQQETLGNLNLNPLNLAKNGIGGIVVPNYDITVPSGKLGKVLDYGAKLLGFESPISLYNANASIFSSENPVGNIERANAQLANTGKGQVLSMFANIKSNNYRPSYQDERVPGDDSLYDTEGKRIYKAEKGSNVEPNIYAFGTPDGKIIDILNLKNDDGSQSKIAQSSIDLNVGKEDFDNLDNIYEPYNNQIGSLGNIDKGRTLYTWRDEYNNSEGLKELGPSNYFNNQKSLLYKTQELFKTNKIMTLVTGHGVKGDQKTTETQNATKGFLSKGSAVQSSFSLEGNGSEPEDVFCRTWTTVDRYNQVFDLQKNDGINTNTAYRKGYDNGDSVLGANGFVKIGPYVGDSLEDETTGENNIKNFMFSLENLAWDGQTDNLLACEKGPGDPMGQSGRIMWFPPYDLSVSENVSANWESTEFIGRGEPIYTYNNTERTGTLQFKIVVDHPSYLNSIRGESDEYIASFFAGCTDIDSVLAEKLTTTEKDEIETKKAPPSDIIEIQDIVPEIPVIEFYFPNDNFEIIEDYENGDGVGLGWTEQSLVDGKPVVSNNIQSFPDRNDFGLNKDGDTAWLGSTRQDEIKKMLNETCQACKINISGFASVQGIDGEKEENKNKNEILSGYRADSVKEWFIDNILVTTSEIYGVTKLNGVEKRFSSIKAEGETNEVGCPTTLTLTDSDGKLIQTQDYTGCKEARKVIVKIVHDKELQAIIDGEKKKPTAVVDEKYRVSKKIINRFYNECNYFQKLREEDRTVYDTLKEKLQFFHPAFHAITPEGLNSRLTFLQQCMRQGPTSITGKPDNLAFGKPPVCILRLGDFYHSKIVIDNMNVSYDPLVWDLNPEGIGVQPMIATVDLAFKMIGGQSMKGPLNKLQNAVSFNFFGNTEIYDVRADKIRKNSEPGKDDYEIVEGAKVSTPVVEKVSEEKLSGINGNGDSKVEVNQEVLSENLDNQEDDTVSNDKKILDLLTFNIQTQNSGAILISWGGDFDGLSKEYNIKLKTSVNGSSGWADVLNGKISATGENRIISTDTNWPNTYLQTGTVSDSTPTITVSFKIIIEIPSEENVYKTLNKVVASVTCVKSNVKAGYILNRIYSNNYIENVKNKTC